MRRPWHSLSASSHGSLIFTGCPPQYQSSGSPRPLTLPALTHTFACPPHELVGKEVWLVGWRPHPPSLSRGAMHGHPDCLASEASLGKGCVGASLACGVGCSGAVRKWSPRASCGTVGRPRRSPGFLAT